MEGKLDKNYPEQKGSAVELKESNIGENYAEKDMPIKPSRKGLSEAYQLEKFYKGLEQLGITCSENQMGQFITYYRMLVEKNKVMNLTSITEWEDAVHKHFIDSLSLTKCIDLNQNIDVLDLGTGAGFPGIPLKIVFPELNFVLMDSLNKRILFIKEVLEELHLTGITAIHGRAEELAVKPEYREKFDLCVSRAVANLSSLSEYCLPFVKVGGNFIPYKSGEIEEEAMQAQKAIDMLGGNIRRIEKFTLPETDLSRSFIQIEKKKKTPKRYPRRAGTPSKCPIK